jgi:dTDP-4-amino-4,6-dideoxygalactose transaminase
MNIRMLDLKGQYEKIREEINTAIQQVLDNTNFIQGVEVKRFEENLASYLGCDYVISCANGTDALQISLMALGLRPGDEVIVPSFTYVATAEVIALLGLTPVLVDVIPGTFNIDPESIEKVLSPATKAIVPVHLFGQCAEMERIMRIASEHNLFVIEDNAQALGSEYTMSDGRIASGGTIGHIGCTSFFPSKNLGCFGDGGAVMTNDPELAIKLRMVANHGQKVKYHHDVVGCNSRLDTLQAAVLDIKLKYLDDYASKRYEAASVYNQLLNGTGDIILPEESTFSTHVYHQYTIRTSYREELREWLTGKGVPSMIYYPLPLHHQEAFKDICQMKVSLRNSESLTKEVLSLPIHTEITKEEQVYIADSIKSFFEKT